MDLNRPKLLSKRDEAAGIDLLIKAFGADGSILAAIDGVAPLTGVGRMVPDKMILDVMMPVLSMCSRSACIEQEEQNEKDRTP